MKIVLAIDSFKGTFSSVEIIEEVSLTIKKNNGRSRNYQSTCCRRRRRHR